jgi:hypothetical protein
MGGGSYSTVTRTARAETMGYATKSTHEIFKQKSINNAMNPYGVAMRESRDSEEHPESLAIVVALDVTGSMGSVPHHLVKEGLPTMMDNILKNDVKDPQVLFLGIGDHQCDNAPLQVGQFESSDELLDKWLTDVYLEGGGGANDGESYLLAWYFAGLRTSIDCFEKRNKKGFLFTIGDEPTLKDIPKGKLKSLMGDGQYQDFSAAELLEKASDKYNVFHLHIKQTYAGQMQETIDGWKQLMGKNLVVIEKHSDVSDTIAKIILEHSEGNSTQDNVIESVDNTDNKTEEML